MSAIIYLLQVSACMAFFYGFYFFSLGRLTFFTINRWYLLFTLLISFVIPALTIHVHRDYQYLPVTQNVSTAATVYAPPNLSAQVHQTAVENTINWSQVLNWGYVLVAIALFVHLLITLIRFFIKLKYRKVDRIGRVNILRGDKNLPNGSFLNYIFLNDDELSPDELQQIIAHEMLHVKYLHSADRIIAKIIQIILWFNPFIYLYARSIEENHEFEVDREIARSTDKNNYAGLLLHLSVARQGMLYHSFSKVPLKKRIVMLFNKPSANMKKALYIGLIPLIILSCFAFARLKNDDKKPVVDKKPFSVVNGLDKLGRTPLVLIDKEPYPSDILYKISSLCIGWTEVSLPEKAVKKYGTKAKDGLVIIYTKNGRVITMTPIERENLVKETAVPRTTFFTRLTLKKENGELYDKIFINILNTTSVATISHGGKAAFFINKEFYDENRFKNLSPSSIASLSDEGPRAWPKLKGYETVLYYKTKTDENKKGPLDQSAPQQQKKDAKIETPEKTTPLYSVIGGSEHFGKNPVVLIDGKEYPAAILYNISGSCLNGSSSGPGNDADIQKYGPRAKDGVINIRTKNGTITYMTPLQKNILNENSAKEAAVPLTQFYTKLVLKKDDGKPYDKIIIHFPHGSETSSNEHGAKAAFYVDGKRYSEDAVKKFSPKFIATLNGEGGIESPKTHPEKWPNVQDCESVIYFTTGAQQKNTQTQPLKEINRRYSVISGLKGLGENPVVLIDDKPYPASILYKIGKACIRGTGIWLPADAVKYYGPAAKDGLVKIKTNGQVTFMTAIDQENINAEASVPLTRFYSRIHLKKDNGEPYDKIIMHPTAGGEVSANLDPDDKAAFLIDEKVYDESNINQVPAATIAKITGEYGVEGNKLWPSLQEYTAIFTFKTIGEKPRLLVADIREFNAKHYKIKSTDHLGDLLKMLPGVTVNDGKSVSYNGKIIDTLDVMNMVPGQKFTRAATLNPMNALAHMPAESIDLVQIINASSVDPNKKLAMRIIKTD